VSTPPRKASGFAVFARQIARAAGHPAAFLGATTVVLLWAVLGPAYDYSDTWQLVINTGTTIVTFLMVFLIQNTQNRDAEAMQVKLDELIRAVEGAHNSLLDLEELDGAELERIRARYAQLAERARAVAERGGRAGGVVTGAPQLSDVCPDPPSGG